LFSRRRSGSLRSGAGEAPFDQFQGKSMRSMLAAALLAALSCAPAYADEIPAEKAQQLQFLRSLHYRSGDVALAGAGATLHVRPGFQYLDSADARKVLEQYWGNPPDESVLGLLVPDDARLDSEHSWAVVVTYSDEGHIADEDAAKVDYEQVMKDMKEASAEENEARKDAGYSQVEIVGWAQPPRYDAASKRIYWARELDFKDAQAHTLNYDIRVLGREGFLSMNAVADMSDMARVQAGMQQVLPMAEFNAGQRYADYKPGSDKLAAYGLAALVGGGIAAKAGLFAKLGVFLLAFKKFILVGLVAVGAGVKKLFGGGKDKRSGGTVA
jgi:uncharacterized membrane-anchored protein